MIAEKMSGKTMLCFRPRIAACFRALEGESNVAILLPLKVSLEIFMAGRLMAAAVC